MAHQVWTQPETVMVGDMAVDMINGQPIHDRVWYLLKFPSGTQMTLQTRVVTEMLKSRSEGGIGLPGPLNHTIASFALPYEGISEIWFRAVDVLVDASSISNTPPTPNNK